MGRVTLLIVALGTLLIMTQQNVEEIMQAGILFYLLITGFAVLFLRSQAWEFLRPLASIGLALIFLPPLFRELLAHAERNLSGAFHYNITLGSEWLIAPIAAFTVFVLFRLLRWHQARPRNVRRENYRERERITPHFDLDDEIHH